jgi:hypothetical protein
MNLTILKLAASHFPRDNEGNISATPESIAEFAKSLVQECAKLVSDDDNAYDILKHFGVEE